MKNLNVNIKASSLEDYYLKILLLLNTEAPPDKQSTIPNLEMLSRFMSLPKEHKYMPFNSRARKIIAATYPYPVSSALFSTRIKRLLEASLLTRDEDGFVDFSPSVKKIRDSQLFTINVSIDQALSGKDSGETKSASSVSGGSY